MSRTTVFRIKNDGQVVEAFEQGNSWRHAPRIWDVLFKKYCLRPSDHEYASWMQYSQRLWDLASDERLTRNERIALLVTFDRVWVPREMIAEVSAACFLLGGGIHGLSELATEDIRGVCFQGTSVSDNSWRTPDDDGLINIDRDNCSDGKKPWSLAEEIEGQTK